MLYLSGHICDGCRPAFLAARVGFLATPASSNRIDEVPVWAADNGCFGKGYPGDEAFLAWLQVRRPHADRCLFAVAPDVVADAAATLIRSADMLPRIRAAGYRAAFVAQDGLERLPVPWPTFDVLFVGGSTSWKLGTAAARLCAEAADRGKRVHVGRVNGARRWRHFAGLGTVDTVDGTLLAFGCDANLHDVHRWPTLPAQGMLL